MKKSRYSDEQIVRILREADSALIAEVAKRHGVSEASTYAWRKRFGEMRKLSETAGLRVHDWHKVVVTPGSNSTAVMPALTILQLVMGDALSGIAHAERRNRDEGRVVTVQALCERL